MVDQISPELTALALLVAFQVVFGLTTTAIVTRRTGMAYIFSGREAEVDLISGFVGRMHRARTNTFEALVYFTPTVVVVEQAGANGPITAFAAWTFLVARIGFVFCYAYDLNPWRSVVWFIGLSAVVAMLGDALI